MVEADLLRSVPDLGDGAAQVVEHQMGVAHRGGDAGVPEQALHDVDVHPARTSSVA